MDEKTKARIEELEAQAAQHAEHAREIDDPDDLVKQLRWWEAYGFSREAKDRIEQLEKRMAETEELLRRGIDGTADNLWVSEVRLFLAEAKQ